MSDPSCAEPIAAVTLLEYWLRELDDREESRIEEHLLGCDDCSAALEQLIHLGGAIRTCVRDGLVRVVVTDIFVWRLAARGLHVREYRVPHNGSVHCTVAPEDNLVIARMKVPLEGVERVNLVLSGVEGEGEEMLRDVPFDAAAGEVLLAPRVDHLRALPASTARIRVIAVEHGGERLAGEYTFIHSPWPPS